MCPGCCPSWGAPTARRPGCWRTTPASAASRLPGSLLSWCQDGAMRTQRFDALVAAAPGGRAVIVVPFDPDEVWGAKAAHPVNGTVGGCRVRVTLAPGDSGWAFTLSPARMRDLGVV